MKQYWRIWLILVLTALTGCVKAEMDPVPEREITFSVGNYATAETKAVSLESYSITSFKSKGFLHAEGYEETTQDFFGAGGETITWNGTDEIWAPSHPYYWPKGASSYINFISWYDKTGILPPSRRTALAGPLTAVPERLPPTTTLWLPRRPGTRR